MSEAATAEELERILTVTEAELAQATKLADDYRKDCYDLEVQLQQCHEVLEGVVGLMFDYVPDTPAYNRGWEAHQLLEAQRGQR